MMDTNPVEGATPRDPALRFVAMRQAMVVSQLRPSGVFDPRVVEAMAAVPREMFVPPESIEVAYIDRPIPLWAGRALNPPVATGLLFDAARIAPGARVLIVAAATGYACTVAARLGGDVTGVEVDARMLELSRQIAGVRIVAGPLAEGAPDRAPYDVIVIDGAVEVVPDALIAQLTPDGRLASGIVERGVTRLAVGRRGGAGFALAAFADSEAVVLPGFARPKVFQF